MVTNDGSHLDVVDEDVLVFETAAKDDAVVWADSQAKDATVTMLLLHLNWMRIGIAAKDFTSVPTVARTCLLRRRPKRTIG